MTSPSSTSSNKVDLLPNEAEVSYERLHDFFNRNKWWMIILGFAVLITAFLFLQSKIKHEQRREEAAKRLSTAQTPDLLKGVIRDYPETEAALTAQFSLADRYFQEANYSEARKAYLEVLKSPTSPLAPSAKYGLGSIEEAQGKPEDALQIYRSIVQDYPQSYQAPLALYSAARILERQGKLNAAQQTYDKLSNQYKNSAWTREAQPRLDRLNQQLKPSATSSSLPPLPATPPKLTQTPFVSSPSSKPSAKKTP